MWAYSSLFIEMLAFVCILLSFASVGIVEAQQADYNNDELYYEQQNERENTGHDLDWSSSFHDTEARLYFNSKEKSWSCDRPWIWFMFPCVWLDLRYGNFRKRLVRNIFIAGSTLGATLFIVIFSICCYLKFSYSGRAARYEQIYSRYGQPGILRLSNGTTLRYEPTAEEQEALFKLHRLMVFAD